MRGRVLTFSEQDGAGLINLSIAFIEFVIYLVKSDQDFYRDYVVGDRSWL